MTTGENDFLSERGGYRSLRAFQVATVIYDVTFYFAHTHLSVGDRTVDQMIQSARSGKQNIVEGSVAREHSSASEMTLTGVAHASLHELLIDYEDYLRVRGLEQWPLNDSRTIQTREFCKRHSLSEDFMQRIRQRSDETIANIAIVLIHQCDYLLRHLLAWQKREFVEHGGVHEQRMRARLDRRSGQGEGGKQ